MTDKIPKEQYDAMRKVCDPFLTAVNKMSGREIAMAMQGLHATSETNCPWYCFGLRHTLPAILATVGFDKPGYQETFLGDDLASAIEARRAATGTGAVHESAGPKDDAQTPPDLSSRDTNNVGAS